MKSRASCRWPAAASTNATTLRPPWRREACWWWRARSARRPTTSSNSNRCWTRSRLLPIELGKPERLLADTGYFSAANVAACAKAGIEPLIAMGRQPHHPPLAERFEAAPEAPEDPTPVEAMAHRLKTPAGRTLYAAHASRSRSRCSGSSNRRWASVNFRCAASTAHAANGASSLWPGTSSGYSPSSRPDKAEVRRLGRQAPGNAISGPSTAFCARPNAPTLLRPAKTILGDQPQSPASYNTRITVNNGSATAGRFLA